MVNVLRVGVPATVKMTTIAPAEYAANVNVHAGTGRGPLVTVNVLRGDVPVIATVAHAVRAAIAHVFVVFGT